MMVFVNANITTTVMTDVFNSTEVFNDSTSLQFAFGVSSFSPSESSPDNNLDFGSVKIRYETWDPNSDTITDIKTRPC